MDFSFASSHPRRTLSTDENQDARSAPTMHRTAVEDDEGERSHTAKSAHHFQSLAFETKAAIYYETDRALQPGRPSSPLAMRTTDDDERVAHVDHSPAMPVAPSSTVTSMPSSLVTGTSRASRASNGSDGTRSSSAYIDELQATQHEGEKRELSTLNHRFGNYLDKIKSLASVNAQLRRQVDRAYRKYIGHTEEEAPSDARSSNKQYQHPCELQLNALRRQINEEVRTQTLLQIRSQRAEFDIKFYQTNIKSLTAHDHKQAEQIRMMRHQLEASVQELEQLKRRYERQGQDLNTYKSQYSEYMSKLMQFSNEYDTIAYARLDNENVLCTLREQLAFEQEFYQRRQEEFVYLEKLQHDVDKQFNQTEFQQILERIRQDYREFNRIRLSELETLYQTKLDAIRKEFLKRQEQQAVAKPHELHSAMESTKKEHHALIEENRSLQDNLEQLEHALHDVIERNQQRFELSDREYRQLHNDIPELDATVVHLRENAVNLWSEINTYRYLLHNLLPSTKEKSPPPAPQLPAPPPPPPIPIEKHATTSTTTEKTPAPRTKPTVTKVTSTTTVGTKARSSPRQYRDETTGFIVHIEDGIIWVRI